MTVRHASFGVVAALLTAMSQAPSAQNTPPPQAPAPAPASPQDVYVVGRDRVAPPVVVSGVKPGYTPEAMRARIQGRVVLRGIVERDGTVSGIEVVQSLDATNGLDQAAINAFRQWRFQPGTVDGKPVRVLVNMDMAFTLRDAEPVQAWPAGFTAAAIPTDAMEERADAPGLRLSVMRPAAWVARRDGPPNEWLGLRSRDATHVVAVLRPETAQFDLRWPASPATLQGIAELSRRVMPGTEVQILATGQIQTTSAFYVWSSLRLPTLPNPPGTTAATNPFGEGRAWTFTRTFNGKVVLVVCSLLLPRGLDGPAVDARVQQAAEAFAPIVNNMVMAVLP